MAARNAKAKEKPYKLAAGAGLYLHVMPNGARYWRMSSVAHGAFATARESIGSRDGHAGVNAAVGIELVPLTGAPW
ncbi:Arm DNA-binding domain-containing protein [uncultured Stenotrophomonas sp.]|uniref:Arm DNA-binding domain-containing protein n=1 Tax=uncultured Stenotrophomonas sp. TaxID=165438 RepID=UPI0031BADF13